MRGIPLTTEEMLRYAARNVCTTVVETAVCKNPEFPVEWRGTLADGRRFIWRFRFGQARLVMGRPQGDQVCVSEELTPKLAALVDDDEFRMSFARLFYQAHGVATDPEKCGACVRAEMRVVDADPGL